MDPIDGNEGAQFIYFSVTPAEGLDPKRAHTSGKMKLTTQERKAHVSGKMKLTTQEMKAHASGKRKPTK